MTFDSSSGQAHESQDLLDYLDAAAHPTCRGYSGLLSFSGGLTG